MYFYVLSAIFIGLLTIFYYYLVQKRKYWEKRGVPTAKYKCVPLLGHMWPFIMLKRNVGDILEDLYNSGPNSSIVGIFNFGTPELLIRDPNLVKEVMQSQFSSFYKNGVDIDHDKDPLLSRNPFFNEGEIWKKGRSVLTNTMSTAKLRNMAMGVSTVCATFQEYLKQQIKLNNGSYEVKAEDLFGRFTSEVVARVGFGINGKSFTNEPGNFLEMVKMVFEPTGISGLKQTIAFLCPPLRSIFDLRFLSVKMDQYFRSVVRDVLETRKQTGNRGNDFIQQIYDTYKSEEGEIDETFITSHALSFMVDGYFTSSYTLSFVVFHIASHPEEQEILRQEIRQVLKKHDHQITYETIQDMKYMDLVIQEAMRLTPVIAFLSRICTENITLTGSDGLECDLRVGDRVVVCPSALQKDSQYWTNPNKFDPSRFKEETNELSKFINIPFGGGPRICPGMRMATLQMKGALTELLNHFSVAISSKTKLPLTYDVTSFLNTASGGIWLKIKSL